MKETEAYVSFSGGCSRCKRGKSGVSIKSFKKDFTTISESSKKIFDGKKSGSNCCWKCKKKTVVGEVWGITISGKERNRIFCPDCSTFIENALQGEGEKA